MSEATTDRDTIADGPSEKELLAHIKRAERGDEAALARLKATVGPGFWKGVGDLAAHAERSWRDLMVGDNLCAKEGLRRKLAALRAELAGPSPSPLEFLLAERVAACWLHLQYVETIYAQNLRSFTLAQADYYQRRIDAAQRRYLQAIKTLAQVRRLLVPIVQVNIAEKAGERRTTGAPGSWEPLTPR